MTIPKNVMLPSDLERRQIFYTLKRWSSYTAWSRILGYFQAWADIHKRSLQIASAQGFESETGLPESDYVMLLQDLAYCEEGVQRLHTGDKRVFQCGPMGAFMKAGKRMLAHSVRRLMYIESGDIGINVEKTPLWDEFVVALTRLEQAWSECSSIVEPDYMGRPTNTVDLPYGVWLQENLPKMPFPDPLPQVPDPSKDVLVRTGEMVECSGIWEPVEVPARKLVVSLFKPEPPKGPFPIIGCMNYLHGGTKVPKASLETDTDNIDVNATWRLLWRDDRYEDGTIPEEEKGYVFLSPEEPKPQAPAPVRVDSKLVVLESGQLAPVAGRWLHEHDLHVWVQIAQGEALPLHEGRKVRWILAVA